MLSTSPLAGTGDGANDAQPYDLNVEIPAAMAPEPPAKESEFVMGPKQVASVAFVGVLLLGIVSAAAYFAGRKNTDVPKPTERIIERVVQVPAPAPPAAAAQNEPKPSVPVLENKGKIEMITPVLNRLYLQAGSVEIGVAEVMVEGLRQRGVPALVGVGINNKVARVLIGPFESAAQQQMLQKKVEDLGFHPYPRSFTAQDLEQQQITPQVGKP